MTRWSDEPPTKPLKPSRLMAAQRPPAEPAERRPPRTPRASSPPRTFDRREASDARTDLVTSPFETDDYTDPVDLPTPTSPSIPMRSPIGTATSETVAGGTAIGSAPVAIGRVESQRLAEPTTLGVVPARGLLAPLHLDEPPARGSAAIPTLDNAVDHEPRAIIPRATRSGTALAHESALEAAAREIVHRRASSSEWAEANVAVDAVPFDDVPDTDNDPAPAAIDAELVELEAPSAVVPRPPTISGALFVRRTRYLVAFSIALVVAGVTAGATLYAHRTAPALHR